MTKQEIIKQVYGEYWDLFSIEEQNSILKNNGWVMKFNHPLHFEIKNFSEVETLAYGVGTSWRPKLLQGIENNNGWIKIESEEDLPTKTIAYHVVRNGKLSKALYAGSNRWFVQGNDYPKTSEMAQITHFQEIIIPEPPIY